MSTTNEIACLEPGDQVIVSGDMDGMTTARFFSRMEWTVTKIIEEVLNLHQDSRLSFMEKNGLKRSGYKDSGEWSHWRDEDHNLRVRVDVGCFCSHDCCGCTCALSYTITLVGGYICVLTHTSRNY
jgi:hypothetical protein